jgi:methylenetetrahydrofolate reductase (NADPH)
VRIDEIIAAEERPVFSFEFFPPKTDDGERNLRAALAELRSLEPDFASVTYGAAGSTRTRTLEVTRWLQQELGIEAMAHLSCVGATREELAAMVDGFVEAGISNILALRGDPPRDQPDYQPHPGGLSYSHELASLITERHPELCVGAACFPEIHPDAGSRQDDLRYLAAKIDNGVAFLITQLFFDNELYFEFVEDARAAGIEVPILPGIMPITDLGQIKTITGLCGATIPAALLEQLERRAGDAEAVAGLGVS